MLEDHLAARHLARAATSLAMARQVTSASRGVNTAHRSLTVSIVISALMALAFAAPAAAGTPPSGQGLIGASEQGITSFSCSDPSITIDDMVFTPGGGAPNWTVDGRMYVLRSIEISGTITTPDGSFPVFSSKTWGNKTGLGDVVECAFEQEAMVDGAALEATGTATVVRIR